MKKVLIIEDNRELSELFQMAFVAQGADVKCALAGHEGLAVFYDFKPHIVLVDLMMPDIDGIEVVKGIRAYGASVYVAVVSNLDTPEYRAKSIDAGADLYLPKSSQTPLEIAEVILEHASS